MTTTLKIRGKRGVTLKASVRAALVAPSERSVVIDPACLSLEAGELGRLFEAALVDHAGPVDLSDADSVKFHMRLISDDAPLLAADATIVDATAGKVRYDWQAGDTDTAGYHRAEFKVTFDGKPIRFPNDDDLVVHIRKAAA
ncbi:MAG TPA: BppU family phage baseplate upper protein [Acidimicrobiales bacterium]|nr:BppU family phage baseplate upper protein [Acidimicrobiales bacterium]